MDSMVARSAVYLREQILCHHRLNRVNLVARRKRQGINIYPGCVAGSWVKLEKASPSTWRTGPRSDSSSFEFKL